MNSFIINVVWVSYYHHSLIRKSQNSIKGGTTTLNKINCGKCIKYHRKYDKIMYGVNFITKDCINKVLKLKKQLQ